MDPLIALLIVVTSVLTVLLVIVGIYVVLILKEFRLTVKHVNSSLSNVDHMVKNISAPFSGMGDTLAGVKSGLKIVETFVTWIKDKNDDK